MSGSERSRKKDPDGGEGNWTERIGRGVGKAARSVLRQARRWEMGVDLEDAKYDLRRLLAKLGAHVEKHFASGCTVLEAAQPETAEILKEIREKRACMDKIEAEIEKLRAKSRPGDPEDKPDDPSEE